MTKIVFILGRDADLSLAEIQALFAKARYVAGTLEWAIFDFGAHVPALSDLKRLGGSLKIGMILQEVPPSSDPVFLLSELIYQRAADPDKKIVYGLSVYGLPESRLRTLLQAIKKQHVGQAIKSRFINKDHQNLSIPQYLHHLSSGKEYLVLKSADGFYLAETLLVQDIDSYAKRDFGKPARNMRMGIMPPKLAQILLNLSAIKPGQTVWDPFCGGGTLLMEGALMGLDMIGSDLSETYLQDTRHNLLWFKQNFPMATTPRVFLHDATQMLREALMSKAVVFEGDLGPPMPPHPQSQQLQSVLSHLYELYDACFGQFAHTLKKGTVIVAALPFFVFDFKTVTLPSLPQFILNHGFDLESFIVRDGTKEVLTYRRPDQRVGRAIYRFIVR